MNKQFAPEYNRSPEGWILFPRDDTYRKTMFPPEVAAHPAKANVYMIQSCIDYVSEEGQTLLDPFGGTGTLMVAALKNRNVVLIDISPIFSELQQKGADMLDKIAPGCRQLISIFNAPLQNILPIPNFADHIITSPPYASLMKSKGTDKLTAEKGMATGEYTFSHPLNLGLYSDWMWAQMLEEAYKKFFATLKPGGTFTLITKDHFKKNQKTEVREQIPLSQNAVNTCLKIGFTLDKSEWYRWKAPGSVFTSIYRARGWETVDWEDVIVLRKPSTC
jgi:DNA modification methylase